MIIKFKFFTFIFYLKYMWNTRSHTLCFIILFLNEKWSANSFCIIRFRKRCFAFLLWRGLLRNCIWTAFNFYFSSGWELGLILTQIFQFFYFLHKLLSSFFLLFQVYFQFKFVNVFLDFCAHDVGHITTIFDLRGFFRTQILF